MSTTTLRTALPTHWTLADLQEHLGGIPLERIRLFPPPGTATEEDVIWLDDHEDRLCELVDGVLVEKPMGYYESMLAGLIIHRIHSFLESHDLGIVLAPDGPLRILPQQVRMPDVCFISWDRFPNRELPRRPVLVAAPDLAIEILSKSNTPREMERKLQDYFTAGVRLVWYIDPETKTARVYTSPGEVIHLAADGVLVGGDVLPGFALPVSDLFSETERKRDA